MIHFKNNLDFARQLDKEDSLKSFRQKFYIPEKNGSPTIYFCGNSLGLQPKNVKGFIETELEAWKKHGVEGHFTGQKPWVSYHHQSRQILADLVGAKECEVVTMNNLTTNLHLLLASFYQPDKKRVKIIIEKGAFPSDYFAVSSHMKMKGIAPEKHLIELEIPENGYLSQDFIVEKIQSIGNELSLVLLPGVQYYTGQFFNLKRITKTAHDVGAYAGFDLAHAAGNLPMNLHDSGVDFAAWCSYKYLNSGPGNISGAFIHEKYCNDITFPRMAGWWGQDDSKRFNMENTFHPMKGIDGWMLSNVNILSTAAHLASLEIFHKAGIQNLRAKSVLLTGYLYHLLTYSDFLREKLTILTPQNPDERGCQLSLSFHSSGKSLYNYLSERGVIMDWREPNVIRVAPTPLYNTFEEVFQFVSLVENYYQTNV